MWPKILVQYLPQLMELLPHISRVVPMADKYLSQRNANDAKLDALADGVRQDLGKVAKAHIDLATRLDQFAGYVGEAADEAKRARTQADQLGLQVEQVGSRVAALETKVQALRTLLIATLCVIVTVALLVIAVLWRVR